MKRAQIEQMIEQLSFLINSREKEQSSLLLKNLCSQAQPDLYIKLPKVQEPRILCTICNQNFPISDIITLNCNHRFCKQDLQRFISEKIGSSSFSPKDLVCRFRNCNSEIDYPIIKTLVSQALFDKYDQALAKQAINPEDSFFLPPKPVKRKCEKCEDQFEISKIRSLNNCDHVFCEQCLRKQFLAIVDSFKNITLEMFVCEKCGSFISYDIVNAILPLEAQNKFNYLINKPAFSKKGQIQLPAILLKEQIKELENYIQKLKLKFEDFKFEGGLKERAQIEVTFIDEAVFKKLKKKIKFFDKLNEKLYKNVLPAEWGDFPENVRVVVLAQENLKYQFVMTEFRKTCQNQIVSISEIQNAPLYKKYKFITSEVIESKKALHIDTTNFEKYLWHGTRQTNPELIYKDENYGFDVRYANNGSWGRGNYFGQTAQVSMGYVGNRNAQGNLILLFNKVFVGESVPGQGGLVKAPPIPGTNRLYDSTSNQNMVVIYDVWRAYPHYIVEFK